MISKSIFYFTRKYTGFDRCSHENLHGLNRVGGLFPKKPYWRNHDDDGKAYSTPVYVSNIFKVKSMNKD